MQIRLFVSFNVRPENIDLFIGVMQQGKAELLKVAGCRDVEIIQSTGDATKIILSEVWESKEIHDKYAAKMAESGAMDGLANLLQGAPEVSEFYFR